jgi:hypothetical protein
MKKSFTIMLLITAAAGMLLQGLGEAKQPAAKKKPVARRHKIAVIRSKYDDVDGTLRSYRIPHDVLSYRDLENPELLEEYTSLFVPSGVDTPMEESLDVYANNFRFKSVALKPDFYEVDKDRVARTLRRFVRSGGSAYFSGYSFEYLQRAFDIFTFFDNFPYMGLSEKLDVSVFNDLSRFSVKNGMSLYVGHPGWIALKSASDAEVISRASYETARGARSGPISLLARRGGGEILYTSYDSTASSEYRRFNIYRIAGVALMRRLEDTASEWCQTVTGRIINAIHDGEYAAMHRLDLVSGINYIYFYSNRDVYQIDVFDRDFSLIESRDIADREQMFSVMSDGGKDRCYIRIYPGTGARYGTYAVISAGGSRIFPYLYHFLAGVGIMTALFVGAAVYRMFFRARYSGRWRG